MRHPKPIPRGSSWRADPLLANVRESEWLRDWPPPVLDKFLDSGRSRHLATDATVATAGVPMDGLHVILSGCLKVTKSTTWGKEFVIRLLPPGRLYGITSTLDGLGNLHNAVAFGRTETWFIPKQALLDALAGHPDLYPHLIRLLCGRVRLSYRIIDTAALMPLRQRLANRLIELTQALGKPDEAGRGLVLSVGQDAIAGLVGATRQSVNRELKAMERAEILVVIHRQIVVFDQARLANIASSVPDRSS